MFVKYTKNERLTGTGGVVFHKRTKTDGCQCMAFTSAASKTMDLHNYCAASTYYDEENKQIGIKLHKDRPEGSLILSKSGLNKSQVQLAIGGMVALFKIPITYKREYRVERYSGQEDIDIVIKVGE